MGPHRDSGGASLAPGESGRATIEFITPEVYPRCLDEGDVLEINEGSRVLGRARILRVLNPLLQRAAGAPFAGSRAAISSGDENPLPEKWMPVDARTGESLFAELQREPCEEHALYGRSLRASSPSATSSVALTREELAARRAGRLDPADRTSFFERTACPLLKMNFIGGSSGETLR